MTLSEFDLNYGLVCVGNGVNFYIMQLTQTLTRNIILLLCSNLNVKQLISEYWRNKKF